MMRTMRASAKWIMGVVAVTFVGWMVFEVGMDATARGSSAGNVVARVNGRAIDATTFYQAVRNEQERRRAEQQPVAVTLEEQQQFEDAVLEQLVQDMLLRTEFNRRGIRVSDQEIVEAARTSPPPEVLELPQFQTEGQFDLQKYQRFVASAADPTFLLALEARYREELPRIKLYEQLTAGVFVADAALWRDYRDRSDSVTIALLQLFPQVAAADTVASDAEVEAYYREHRSDFEQPAVAHLSFVAVSRRANAADSAAAVERAAAIREELRGGADFADVAARESADSASRAKGGDLGAVPRGSFVPEFERAALALRPGQISDPVSTQFGLHIIRLESKTDSTLHARHILIPIRPVGEHLATVEAMADTLDLFAAEQDDPTALDRVAERLALPVARAPALFEGDRLQLGRFLVPDAGVWAFGGAQAGETSPVIETDYAYYVFRLDSLQAAGVPPLARVRESVRALAGSARQQQAMRALAGGIGADLRAGRASLESVAERYGLSLRTVGPFTRYEPPTALQGAPEVVGAAFGVRVGQTGGPIHTEISSYSLRPVRKTQADSSVWRAQLETQRIQMIRRARQERVQLVLASLREQATVRDLRKELQRAQREAQNAAPQAPQAPVF